jgi:hypothetical protein
MVASRTTTEQIVEIVLKHMDKRTARRMARELYGKVNGNKSVTDTFRRLVEALEEAE